MRESRYMHIGDCWSSRLYCADGTDILHLWCSDIVSGGTVILPACAGSDRKRRATARGIFEIKNPTSKIKNYQFGYRLTVKNGVAVVKNTLRVW